MPRNPRARPVRPLVLVAALLALAALAPACSGGEDALTVYSGRSEDLVAPLIAQFEEVTGIEVEVRYGDSAELAATILEEGGNTPADVFFAQDPASLGTVALEGLLAPLSGDVLDQVPVRFSDTEGRWVGVSGRARVVVYDPTKVAREELPPTEDGFADPAWAGRLGVAPTNGSFLAFVAAKILMDGEDATRRWLEQIEANDEPTFPGNSVIVTAVDDGQVDAGLVNHYYLLRHREEDVDAVAENYFFPQPTAGSLVMPAGVGIVTATDAEDSAMRFVEFLLSEEAQRFFAQETFEYPLAGDVEAHEALPSLDSLPAPELDLSRLATVLDLATDLVAQSGLL